MGAVFNVRSNKSGEMESLVGGGIVQFADTIKVSSSANSIPIPASLLPDKDKLIFVIYQEPWYPATPGISKKRNMMKNIRVSGNNIVWDDIAWPCSLNPQIFVGAMIQ